MKRFVSHAVLVGMWVGIFGLGFLCGSITQHRADAQGVGGLLEQAGKMGGSMGTVGQLGSSIVEMQQHVTGLQKNLDTLKGIESALTGSK
ncbi:MAG TPA: hypothetical protein VMS64_24215 [Candidatus Methylomirabilis sp.]|nr:hypothetical protein [Candidatus Methylomirabilis sp.]